MKPIAFKAAGLPVSVFSLAVLAGPALAQPLPTAARTIFLPRGPGTGSTPMAVAYHPGFDRYYASNGGNPGFAAWVFDSAGTRIQDLGALGIDARGWNYNPGTGKLEVTTFNATANGLKEAMVDGSGNLTGVAGNLLASLAVAGSQSMPAYDALNDVLYSREAGNTVNVISRATGALSSTIALNFAGAGVLATEVTQFSTGCNADAGWIIVTDHVRARALVFDLSGGFLGASQLDINVPTSFRMGYANGQLFVFDDARNGWQGYDIGGGTPPCYPDCDTSTGVGVLDIFDFLCFQNRYDAGAPYACDCDQSTGPGVCDIFDFLCFQNAYDAGCP